MVHSLLADYPAEYEALVSWWAAWCWGRDGSEALWSWRAAWYGRSWVSGPDHAEFALEALVSWRPLAGEEMVLLVCTVLGWARCSAVHTSRGP